MKKIKKILSVLISVLLISSFVACKNNEVPDSSHTGETLENGSSSVIEETSEASSNESKEESENESSAPETSTSSASSTIQTPVVTEKTENEKLFGRWVGSYDIAPILALQGIVVNGQKTVNGTISFTPNGRDTGTYSETLDKTSMENVLKEVIKETLDAELQKNHLSKEDFEAQQQMTVTEYINLTTQSTLSLISLTMTREYAILNNNKIFFKETQQNPGAIINYSLNGNILSLTEQLNINEEGLTINYTKIS